MSTPSDQLPPTKASKTSVGTVLRAIIGKKGGKPADPTAAASASTVKKFQAGVAEIDKRLKKELPDQAPTGLAAAHAAVLDARAKVPTAPASEEDHRQALLALKTVADRLKDYAAAFEQAGADYKEALKKLKPTLENVKKQGTADVLVLEQAKAEVQRQLTAAQALAATDPGAATAALDAVQKAADKLTDAARDYVDCYDAIYEDGKADVDYLRQLERTMPPSPAMQPAIAKYQDVMRQFHAGSYATAKAGFADLRKQIDQLKKDVEATDKVAKPKAEAAKKRFTKLAGADEIATLGKDERAALVKKLAKLPLSEQTELLADLNGPSGELDAESRAMMRATYLAMKLDEDFKKADDKRREATREELTKDTELQDTIDDWDKASTEQRHKALEKVLAAQCKAYGVPQPALRWYDGKKGSFGGFNTTSGIISLNNRYLHDAKEMIDTILHENAHNYQDQLVKRYFAGTIDKSDPVYEQAKAFALTHHMDAYVDSDEDSAVYKVQPEEMHAWDTGNAESAKLMAELADAKRARDGGGQKKGKD